MDWIYSANEGDPLEKETLTPTFLDKFLLSVLLPRIIPLAFIMKRGENLRDVMAVGQQVIWTNVDSLENLLL